jgi:hypothetical protein
VNWQKEAINDLRAYASRVRALENMKERISLLESKYKTVRSAMGDTDAVKGGGSKQEELLINNIAERERLKLNMRATAELVKLTRKGLDNLTERQIQILNSFYIEHYPGHVERLCEEFHVEQSQIYRLKDEALYRFTLGMYGIIDL